MLIFYIHDYNKRQWLLWEFTILHLRLKNWTTLTTRGNAGIMSTWSYISATQTQPFLLSWLLRNWSFDQHFHPHKSIMHMTEKWKDLRTQAFLLNCIILSMMSRDQYSRITGMTEISNHSRSRSKLWIHGYLTKQLLGNGTRSTWTFMMIKIFHFNLKMLKSNHVFFCLRYFMFILYCSYRKSVYNWTLHWLLLISSVTLSF